MRFKLLLLFSSLFIVVKASAQSRANQIGIETDNDSYLANGSDRYYTNGLFIYYNHALALKKPDSTSLANKILGFETGQKLFNPQTGDIPAAIYVDRPFAAYLYIGSTLNFLYKNESSLKLSAQLGVVGPAALGEPTQKLIHRIFGFYTIVGWQYQIKNDPELNLSAQYTRLLARASYVDISATGYGNLGNGFTGAGLGPLLRLGNFNQLFHSAITQSTLIKNELTAPLHKHEFFLYYKPQINYVAYDATIQGGLLEDHNVFGSQEVTLPPERFVLSNQVGASYTSNRLVLDASVIFHSKEINIMVHSQQWGTITAFYNFN